MPRARFWPNSIALILLLLIAIQLLIGKTVAASPTTGETENIMRGYVWLAQRSRSSDTTPMLGHLWTALPPYLLLHLNLPADGALWSEGDAQTAGCLFWKQLGSAADQVLFLARLPNVFLMLILAAFIYRWTRELYGPAAGLLALLLCAFDPNLLAHAYLATPDLTAAALALAAMYWLWKLARQPTILHLFASGIWAGLALAAQFSIWLFLPAIMLLIILRSWDSAPYRLPIRLPFVASLSGKTRPGKLAWLVASGGVVALIALLTVWVSYGFEIGTLRGITVLAPSYLIQLKRALLAFTSSQAEHFIRGELYVGWRWYALLISFLLKTPLPTLSFLAVALLMSFMHSDWRQRQDLTILFPPTIFFCLSLFNQANPGYCYILPALPFLLIYAGRAAALIERRLAAERAFAENFAPLSLFFALLGWFVFGTISIHPHYLAYFNEIAGGSHNGWQSLVDQDLDRGQGLSELKEWMTQHGASQIKLAYQGDDDPAFHNLSFEPLPGPADTWETRRSFYPADPAPGLYAISVNSLQGLHLPEPNTYAWFRQRQPLAKVGYAIFIYEAPRAAKDQAVVSLSGLRPADIASEDYQELFETNDVQFKWFNMDWAFVFPTYEQTTSPYYLIAGKRQAIQLAEEVSWTPLTTQMRIDRHGQPYSATQAQFSADQIAGAVLARQSLSPVWWSPAVTFLPGDPAAHAEQLLLPVNFGNRVELLGYTLAENTVKREQTWMLITWWRVRQTDTAPLKVFAHLIDDKSRLHGGDDRLDVPTDGWEAGDVFYQVHRIEITAEMPTGMHQIELGWYDAQTIERLEVFTNDLAIADRVLLTPVEVAP